MPGSKSTETSVVESLLCGSRRDSMTHGLRLLKWYFIGWLVMIGIRLLVAWWPFPIFPGVRLTTWSNSAMTRYDLFMSVFSLALLMLMRSGLVKCRRGMKPRIGSISFGILEFSMIYFIVLDSLFVGLEALKLVTIPIVSFSGSITEGVAFCGYLLLDWCFRFALIHLVVIANRQYGSPVGRRTRNGLIGLSFLYWGCELGFGIVQEIWTEMGGGDASIELMTRLFFGFSILNVSTGFVLYAWLLFVAIRIPARVRSDSTCDSCGYNLTGNESGHCPECGFETTEKQDKTEDSPGFVTD
ncbi:MAG: hypothetical protein O7G85_01035 [Planctomycetota bacterium]|nr:hypothetical protein [Planctomycetota bacterium]